MKEAESTTEKVLSFTRREGLLLPGDCVIVALSGGADSVALFHLLRKNSQALGIRLRAAHFNHGLRGKASDADEQFVRRLCAGARVPLDVEKGNMSTVPKPKGEGTEAWGRRLRYAFFERLADQYEAKVATGHTRSDNAETVLFHAIRGSGTRGLSGIHPVRGRFVRPLLPLGREEVRLFCQENGYAYVEDATNEDPAFTRNLLRLSAMPVLEQAHPGAEKALDRLSRQMRDVDSWLEELALQLLQKAQNEKEAFPAGWHLPAYDAETFLAAAVPVRRKALSLLLGPRTDHAALLAMEQVLCGELRAAVLPGGQSAVLRNGRFLLLCPEDEKPPPSYEMELRPGQYALPGGYNLEIGTCAADTAEGQILENPKKGYTFCADYDKIYQYGMLRTRRKGDRFYEAGRGVGKTLKKWMSEKRIDRELRGYIPLMAQGQSGRILWVWGAGFSQGLQPGKNTKTILWVKTDRPFCTKSAEEGCNA